MQWILAKLLKLDTLPPFFYYELLIIVHTSDTTTVHFKYHCIPVHSYSVLHKYKFFTIEMILVSYT